MSEKLRKLSNEGEPLSDEKLLSLRRSLIDRADEYFRIVEARRVFDQEVLNPSGALLVRRLLEKFSENPTEQQFRKLQSNIHKSAWKVMRDKLNWVVERFQENQLGQFPDEEARASSKRSTGPCRPRSAARLIEGVNRLNPWEQLVFSIRGRFRGSPTVLATLLGMTPEEVIMANAKIEAIYNG